MVSDIVRAGLVSIGRDSDILVATSKPEGDAPSAVAPATRSSAVKLSRTYPGGNGAADATATAGIWHTVLLAHVLLVRL